MVFWLQEKEKLKENKALQKEIKQLKVGAIQNQLNGIRGNSSLPMIRNPMGEKNINLPQSKKQASMVDPKLVLELKELRRKNTADRKERLGRLSALRKAGSQGKLDTQEHLLPKEGSGWLKLVDPASGEFYYFNERSGDTVWDCPVDFER